MNQEDSNSTQRIGGGYIGSTVGGRPGPID